MRRILTALALAAALPCVADAQNNRAAQRLNAERQVLTAIARTLNARPIPLSGSVHCQALQQTLRDSRIEAFTVPRPFPQVRKSLPGIQATMNRNRTSSAAPWPHVTRLKIQPDLTTSATAFFQFGPSWLLDSAMITLNARGNQTELCLNFSQ